jgi:cytochrome c peroxidase
LTVDGDPARVQLGNWLFSDPDLSHSRATSCASCHPLDRGGVDGRRRALAADGRQRLRNTPTVFNVRYNLFLNWDGAHESLAQHVEAVLLSGALMATSWPELLGRLQASSRYVQGFGRAYADGLTRLNVLDALVSFERSLVTPDARIDRYLRGQHDALDAEELRGYRLFKSYGCVACHQGVNVGGNLVQRFGVFSVPDLVGTPALEADPGRFRITGDALDTDVFRVPSLRNVALTAPYFHDGRAPTLEVAIRIMGQAQLGRTLSAQDIRSIAAFLRTLTGRYEGVKRPTEALANRR